MAVLFLYKKHKSQTTISLVFEVKYIYVTKQYLTWRLYRNLRISSIKTSGPVDRRRHRRKSVFMSETRKPINETITEKRTAGEAGRQYLSGNH